jgi:hypothetical protein
VHLCPHRPLLKSVSPSQCFPLSLLSCHSLHHPSLHPLPRLSPLFPHWRSLTRAQV